MKYVLLYLPRGRKKFLVRADAGEFHSHRGVVSLEEAASKGYGSIVESSTGEKFYVFRPLPVDVALKMRRRTQIIYPKDAGYMILKSGICPGSRVVEGGTGTGALTIILSHIVGDGGKVYSYEVRQEFMKLAMRNVNLYGYPERVEFKLKDICEGIDEEEVDAVFLDIPNPWDAVDKVWKSLKPSRVLCVFVPSVNQVEKAYFSMSGLFEDIEIVEIFLRRISVTKERVRPETRMIGHTGYIITGRKVVKDEA